MRQALLPAMTARSRAPVRPRNKLVFVGPDETDALLAMFHQRTRQVVAQAGRCRLGLLDPDRGGAASPRRLGARSRSFLFFACPGLSCCEYRGLTSEHRHMHRRSTSRSGTTLSAGSSSRETTPSPRCTLARLCPFFPRNTSRISTSEQGGCPEGNHCCAAQAAEPAAGKRSRFSSGSAKNSQSLPPSSRYVPDREKYSTLQLA